MKNLEIDEMTAKRKLKQGRDFVISLIKLGYDPMSAEIREIEESLTTLEFSMRKNRIKRGF